MRSKFGGAGDDEEEDDEVVKREMEENEPRTKHSIDGILGDRCKCKRSDFTSALCDLRSKKTFNNSLIIIVILRLFTTVIIQD